MTNGLTLGVAPPRGPRLRTPLELLVEPVEHDRVAQLLDARLRVDAVILPLDPHELYLTPEHAERREHLLRFGWHDVRIVGAVNEEHRRRDPVRLEERRPIDVHILPVPRITSRARAVGV